MTKSIVSALAAIGVSATLSMSCSGTSDSDTPSGSSGMYGLEIATSEGIVQGTLTGSTRSFLGIPYAAPPVGALRWAHPRPHGPWSTPLVATTFGPRCPQADAMGQPDGDEDCLTLNVWAPENLRTPAPVMVHFHGGGFVRATSATPDRDGQLLSQTTGAIVVTINYRLGPLGFLADPELTGEDGSRPASGNYGFEDQRAALEWVQSNIAAFGGDPDNVTLFGDSAGGTSANLHMRSPLAMGLFHRAILESAVLEDSLVPMAEREEDSKSFAEAVGCAGESARVACLREKSVTDLLSASSTVAKWGPVIDDWNIPSCASTLTDASCVASPVPVLLGTNLNESEFYFATSLSVPVDDADYLRLMDELFESLGEEIVGQYPAADFASPGKAAADAVTDAWFVCPARRLARSLAGAGLPVFLYSFNHAPVSPMFPDAGAFHASQVPFVFGSSMWGIELDEAERELSETMMGYWGRMAENGDPNGNGALVWPALNNAEVNIVLDLSLSTTEHWKDERCNFWDALG